MAPSAVDCEPSQLCVATERLGDLVEQAVIGRVEEQPDIGDRDHRQDGRREIGHAQQGAAGQLPIHEDRHREGERDRDRNGAPRVDRVVRERLPEDRVGQHVVIVPEADEAGRAVRLGRRIEGVDEGRDDRDMGEGREQHDRGQEQEPGLDGRHADKATPRRRARGFSGMARDAGPRLSQRRVRERVAWHQPCRPTTVVSWQALCLPSRPERRSPFRPRWPPQGRP